MKIEIDASKTGGTIEKYWTKCVGSCHAATALREDWRIQLRKCRKELEFEFVRFHGLLDDDMSVCQRRSDGSLEYSFFNVDSIFDFLVGIGMKPFIELSFMPEALASGKKTIFHYKGNITPPASYDEWAGLVGALAAHLALRYGAAEVRSWPFEVWNEPNLDFFWAGTFEEYFSLYRSAAHAIKAVDPALRVGGPATAIDAWIPEFRKRCEETGTPLDFISTHHYPTDAAFGMDMGLEDQMARAKRGVLHDRTLKALREAGPLPLYYTEWNCSPSPRDPYHDTPYNAAFVVKTIVGNLGLLDCYSYWAFTDIFEENGQSSRPYHGGFGLLNVHGIPKPSYRAFQLLSQLEGGRLDAETDGASPTVDCAAARGSGKVAIVLSNHAVPKAPIEAARIELIISGSSGFRSAWIERIDEDHANPERAWREMGSPAYLDASGVERLMKASELRREAIAPRLEGERISIELTIEPHAVVAVVLER